MSKQASTARWRLNVTGFGLTWLLASAIIFILAANYSNNLLLFISLILLALFCNSSWLCWLNVRRLSLNTIKLTPVFAQQSGDVTVQVNNPDGKIHPGIYLHHQPFNSNNLVNPSRQKLLSSALHIKPLKRGCYPLNSLQLQSEYPLGLIRCAKAFNTQAVLWVYPTPQGRLPLPKPKAKQGTFLKREQGDFSHVRTYQRGDSLNHIAWKQMARTGVVMTKEFDGGEGLRQTMLALGDVKKGNLEHQLSQLCRWILDCHQQQLKYGISLPNHTIEAAQGEAHKENCLQALAQFGYESAQ